MIDGQRGVMVGIINSKVAFTPFEKAIKHHKDINLQMLEMSRILAL
jgi:6-phosphofructokinase 1